METERIESDIIQPYSNLVGEYINASESEPYFPNSFSHEGLVRAAENRDFSHSQREILIKALKNQYKNAGIELEGKVLDQVNDLQHENTFTVTTGHQLCLLTGPLYFIIKILQTIKLADQLNAENEKKKFIPVFWMASEDHDFAEINHVHLFGKTYSWDDDQEGKVGAFKLNSLDPIIESINEKLGTGENAEYLKNLFSDSYNGDYDLAASTRKLVHELFGERGLVILNGDDATLKKQFSSTFIQEIDQKVIFSRHAETINNFDKKYKIQVNPRPINIFYIDSGLRELILEDGDSFKLKNSNKSWTRESLITEIKEKPQNFSPNVVLRPMYQEKILPNVCYIGGQAEIAYWLQLKSSFKAFGITFPLLNLRNSVMWLDKGKLKKINKLNISVIDLFLDESEITKKLADFEDVGDSLDDDLKNINDVFLRISTKIESIDASMKPFVMAEGRKIEKQLEQLRGRLMKSSKAKNEERINSYWNLHEKIFPMGSLHERYDNFVPYFLNYGWSFFDQIYESINPEDSRLILIKDV